MKIKWKYNIGQIIHNEKLNIEIIDKEIRERIINIKGKPTKENCKYYKYKCKICGYTGWKNERKMFINGCPCCSGNIIVKGINSLGDKRPDLLIYFKNKEDAYDYAVGSHYVVDLKCPICGEERPMEIRVLAKRGFSCRKCGDNISYPEKFIKSFLEQVNVKYIYQLSKKNFNWCDKYKYDYYIEDYNCIIEVNGSQHYNKCFTNKGAKTLEQTKLIDEIKEELALNNGIDYYIKIDCRKSEPETIKNGIINSNLCNILNIDIGSINFNKCAIDANRNIMREVCNFYNQHKDMTPPMIAPYFNINRVTVLDYLKRGAELGLCDYDVEKAKIEAKIKGATMAGIKTSKQINVYDMNNNFIGTFSNAAKAKEFILKRYNIELNVQNIRNACRRKDKQYKGYYFEDVEIQKGYK